jgi:hypothetical protein
MHETGLGGCMLHHLRRITIFAALAIAACGPFHRAGPPDPIVVFNNQSVDQADVYAVGTGGDPVRIGTVFGGRRDSLHVRMSAVGGSGSVNIIARIFASSRAPRTGSFALSPGEIVEVTLSPDGKILSVLPAP